MPAFNVAPYLATAVESVLRQTWPDLELVIVDDGSTDDTLAVAMGFEARCRGRITVIHQPNRGLAAARNTALAASRGRLLALLDSDDVWEPGFLEAQVGILERRPEIDIVTGNAFFLGGPAHGRPARPHPDPRAVPALPAILADEAAVFIMSVFRRRVYASLGGFDESLRTNEDYEFWLRAAHAGFRFARNSTPLGWYRVRPTSLSADQTRMMTGAVRVYRSFAARLPADSDEAAILARQVRRFEVELLAPLVRRGIAPPPLSHRDFLRGVRDLRGAPRKQVGALVARYAPWLLHWIDRTRRRHRTGVARTVNRPQTAAWHAQLSFSGSPITSSTLIQRFPMRHAEVGPPVGAAPLTPSDPTQHAREIAEGERFEFGSNWAQFLTLVDEERIGRAEESLRTMLNRSSLEGLRFLDIGSGSGLFSLAARRLGARVRSFDYDPKSVACTRELRRRYFPDDPHWEVSQGSVLDAAFVRSLGTFDVVYSWGVLHHTGHMWDALELAGQAVAPGGLLFIAIYNDMGAQSARWRAIKKTYVRLPPRLRPAFAALVSIPEEAKGAARALLKGRPSEYIRTWTGYRANRGMSKWRDIVDWVGGYPYEAAKPDVIFQFFKARSFSLENMRCLGGLGCNEFVFRRAETPGRV